MKLHHRLMVQLLLYIGAIPELGPIKAMKDLHWLKIQRHNQFKVLVGIYQCINCLVPLFVIHLPDLKLTKTGYLQIPCCNLSQVCNISIRYAEPRVWNELLQNIRMQKYCSKHSYSANVITVNPFYLSVNSL